LYYQYLLPFSFIKVSLFIYLIQMQMHKVEMITIFKKNVST